MNRVENAETEIALLKKIAAGDHEAFQTLYDLHQKSVYFYLYRFFNDKVVAEDVHVEVFTQVWKSAGRFKAKSKVRTWIFGIARNLAMNEIRKRKHHINIDAVPEPAFFEVPEIETDDKKKVIKRAMEKIPPKHQQVLDLVFFHEMNYQEIAELLNISVNTVKTRIFHAKAGMKKTLDKMGVNRHDCYT